MLRLVFTVCLATEPDICEQRELQIFEQIPLMACMTGAIPELAVWRQTHPNWRIARWGCVNDRLAARN